MKNAPEKDHRRIIPTARMVAYFRSFSDIPYAKEVSSALRGEEAARQIHGADCDVVTRFCGPFVEARYKCFEPFIAEHVNILELAVGASVERGLCISDDPGKTYVGTDLPEMIADAKAFLERLNAKPRHNHHLMPANVLSFEDLEAAAGRTGSHGPLLTISEGLWMFLTAEEQAIAAQNIRRVLQTRGGQWVTPDITDAVSRAEFVASLAPEMRSAMPGAMKRMVDLTGRDLDRNYFDTREQAIEFFERTGFEVEQRPMLLDSARLSSTQRLWSETERGYYEAGLRLMQVWVMSLRRGH